jgi:diaminopimelate epimerase
MALLIRFHKYHGTGNDFILVDNRDGGFNPNQAAIARLCDRHFGIGADGLILLYQLPDYDFGMSYFNSDGRESSMCGNGGRCMIAFADFLSLIKSKCRFLAIDGPHDGVVLAKHGNLYQVSIRMKDVDSFINWKDFIVVNTGSPHLICKAEDLQQIDIKSSARPLRYHEDFKPDGINVNFIQDKGDHLNIRSYERGVEDETLSCGTGVTAAALTHAWQKDLKLGKIEVHTEGGILYVHFTSSPAGFSDIWLEGPVQRVFEGNIDTILLEG